LAASLPGPGRISMSDSRYMALTEARRAKVTSLSEPLLRSEADAVLASGALGRSPLLKALFEYLLEQSLEGRRVTEFDVASEVFDRGEQFSSTLDASVRVYIHRLRRKLEGGGVNIRTVRGLGYLLEAQA